MDEGMLYVVTRVITRKGFIVAYRALITGGRAMFEEQSIHVADVVEMSKEYSAPPIRSVFSWDAKSSDPPPPSTATGLEEVGSRDASLLAGVGVWQKRFTHQKYQKCPGLEVLAGHGSSAS
jgi:hypothetical protein